jgi:hypothetical protein
MSDYEGGTPGEFTEAAEDLPLEGFMLYPRYVVWLTTLNAKVEK